MKFREYNQKQMWLIPPNIEDEIKKEDICRVIDDVVEAIDTSCIENKYVEEGNLAFNPKMMLKALFYSYSKGIFSSRKISEELERNIYYWYLSGKQKPDFRTICLFRSKHINEIRNIFHEVVKLCLNLGMSEIGTVTIDGTKIKANASRDKTRDKEWIEKVLEEAEKIDLEEDKRYGADKRGDEIPPELHDRENRLKKIKELKEKLSKEGKKYINETDSDAGLMLSKGRYISGFNCQAVVDAKSKVILETSVTNMSNDWNELKANIQHLKEAYNEKPDTLLADAGYSSTDNIRYLNDEGIYSLIPDKSIRNIKYEKDGDRVKEGRFKKSQFIYDRNNDVYICPEKKELIKQSLIPTTIIRKSGGISRPTQYKCKDCSNCKSRADCCGGKTNRCISRYEDEHIQEEMAIRIRSKQGYELYRQRMKTAEPVFGNIKQNIGFREFSLRGLIKTRGEFYIIATVHNLVKIKSYLKGARIRSIIPAMA